MSEDWSVHACDVRLRNLSQLDGYKVLIPLLIKEMESRVANPCWNELHRDDSSVECISDDDGEDSCKMNNTKVARSENDNLLTSPVILGSFEEVLKSIKCAPKKVVNKDSIKDSDHVSPPNTKDKVNTSSIKTPDRVMAPNFKTSVNENALKESDIVLEKVDRDKVFDSESSEIETDSDSYCIEFVGEEASKMPKVVDSVMRADRFSSCSSDIMEIVPDINIIEPYVDDDPNDDTRWLLNTETEKYEEVSSNPRGFKLKKMAVLVKEEHDYNKYLAEGPVKTRVKMRNVRKQLGLMSRPTLDSVIVERRTETSHPFICPFYCPVYNVPCEAMFRVTEQEFFIEHVSNKNCPYAPRSDSPVEPLVRCDKCGDDIPETKLKDHMDDNHHTHTCPGCKDKFECKIDVEDHIINEHSTHFMSNLPRIYRRTPKEPPPQPTTLKTYGGATHDMDTYQPDTQTQALQPYVGHSPDGRIVLAPPLPSPQGVITSTSIRIAPQPASQNCSQYSVNNIRLVAPTPQGVMASSSIQLGVTQVTPTSSGACTMGHIRLVQTQPAGGPGPRLMVLQQQPQQQVVSLPSGQRVLVNNGQIRTSSGQLLQITPGLASKLARQPGQPGPTLVPAPPPPVNTPVLLPNKTKLQQLKLPSGQLVWAQAVASEPIPGSDKAKIQFKVIGPVKSTQQVPGVVQINPHNPHAPTPAFAVPTSVQAAPPTTPLHYRPIFPRGTLPLVSAPDPTLLGFKPVRVAQPLQLLHVDRDGAPVYQNNGLQPAIVRYEGDGAPAKLKTQLLIDGRVVNSMKDKFNSVKLVPMNQIVRRSEDHDYTAVDPLDEGVDPLEGLDPYDDEGVDPLANDAGSSSSPIVLMDDCPDVPAGEEDIMDISSLCLAHVEG